VADAGEAATIPGAAGTSHAAGANEAGEQTGANEDGSFSSRRSRESRGDKVQGGAGGYGVGLGADVGIDSAELMRGFHNRNK
jgi:hypothetical protein